MKNKTDPRYVYFGTGEIAHAVLTTLIEKSLSPLLVVTAPDRPQGRGMENKPSAVGLLAASAGIETLKPEAFDSAFLEALKASGAECFVVADYGAILPKVLLDIPPKGVLNMHPSLLPRLRGPSPIRSALLQDEKTVGVSIMLLDEKMDHGPILAQKKVVIPNWPIKGRELDETLASEGGELLAQALPLYLEGKIEAKEQNHDIATYCKQFSKQDGEINLADDPYTNLLKICAFDGWPGTYTFFERAGKRIRVQILDAHIERNSLRVTKVKPEGKAEMSYDDFMRSGAKPL